MVIAHLIGGLGNQMFQYAAARALAAKRNTSLLLDISSFDSYTLHQGFELNRIFSGDFNIAQKADMHKMLGWQSLNSVKSYLHRPALSWLRNKALAIEPSFEYWQGFKRLSADTYLSGYWQSERYFISAEDIIREDFRFSTPLSAENVELADMIRNSESISLHVRRGDYINNSAYASCSLNYYKSAIEYLTKQLESPTFFIFSDDINWVKENLKLAHPHVYIDNNQGDQSYNDMRLMSLCKHNIIANSSFSWWGAWLNANDTKTVIAPKKWFNTDMNSKDLIPASWVRL
jgi:hypothetical protein